jgi:hypothetical protein
MSVSESDREQHIQGALVATQFDATICLCAALGHRSVAPPSGRAPELTVVAPLAFV